MLCAVGGCSFVHQRAVLRSGKCAVHANLPSPPPPPLQPSTGISVGDLRLRSSEDGLLGENSVYVMVATVGRLLALCGRESSSATSRRLASDRKASLRVALPPPPGEASPAVDLSCLRAVVLDKADRLPADPPFAADVRAVGRKSNKHTPARQPPKPKHPNPKPRASRFRVSPQHQLRIFGFSTRSRSLAQNRFTSSYATPHIYIVPTAHLSYLVVPFWADH